MASATARRPWTVGSLVVHKDEPLSKQTIRVVLGYRRDGRCVTAYAEPAPWLELPLLVESPGNLRSLPRVPLPSATCRRDCAHCPLLAGCAHATENRPPAGCFMARMRRPCA